MANETINIKQGDADTITDTVTGLASLSGYTAKIYIYQDNTAKTAVGTITGSVSDLVVTYAIVNETSKAFAVGNHLYETKIFDSSDHVYTTNKGQFNVLETVNEDPS